MIRNSLFFFVALAFLSSVFGVVHSQQDLSLVKQKVTKLSETVYLLVPDPPLGGNLAVSVGADGILLVDD